MSIGQDDSQDDGRDDSQDGALEIGRIPTADLPPGTMKGLSHAPYDVLVANVGGEFFAIEDACPHSGQSLCRGKLDGTTVTCRGHGWALDVRNGRVLTAGFEGEGNPTYRVREDGSVLVVYR